MKRAAGVLIAGTVLPALLLGADAAPCRLPKNLYDDRLSLAQKQGPAEGPAGGGLLPPGKVAPVEKLAVIDDQYRQFLSELSNAIERKDTEAVKSCCEM